MRTILYLLIFLFNPFLLHSQSDAAIDDVRISGDGTEAFPVVVEMQILNLGNAPVGFLAVNVELRDADTDEFIEFWGADPIRNIPVGDTVIVVSKEFVFQAGRKVIESIEVNCVASGDADDLDESNNFVSLVHFLASCEFSFSDAQQAFLEFFNLQDLPPLAAIFMFPQVLGPQTNIESFNGEEFSEVLSTAAWFAMLIKNPLDFFEKPVEYFLLDCGSGVIRSINSNWFPIIGGVPWNPTIFSNNVIHGTPPAAIDTPEYSAPMGSKLTPDSTCALLVGGTDPNDTIQKTMNNSLQLMKRNLSEANWGPNISSEDIVIKEGIGRIEIVEEIEKLQQGYQKIYFYYVGHGLESGSMATGSGIGENTSYQKLFLELLKTDATDLCVIIEACYSGTAIQAFEELRKDFDDFEEPIAVNVSIYTSSSEDTTSQARVPENLGYNQGAGDYSFGFHASMFDSDTDINGDSCITLEEAHDATRRRNWAMIMENQMPQKYEYRGHELAQISESIIDELSSTYGNSEVQSSEVYLLTTLLRSGIDVQSFDEEFNVSVVDDCYFAWVDWTPQARFGKDVTYILVSPDGSDIQFHDNIQFWPVVPELPDFNAFDSSFLIQAPDSSVSETKVPSTLTDSTATSDDRDSTCAILLSGKDPRSHRENAFRFDIDLFKKNLLHEKLGAQLNEANMIELNGIGVDSILSLFRSLRDQYAKIYFYYSGHGSDEGYLCTGDEPSDWISYDELFRGLDGINANDYCVILDCCYSGLALPAVKKLPSIQRVNYSIYAGSNNTKFSYDDIHKGGNGTTWFGFFTLNFLRCYGDPLAESDEQTGITFKEAFDWLFKQNPEDNDGNRAWPLSCPMHLIHRRLVSDDVISTVIPFEDLDIDLTITSENRSFQSIDLTGQLEFNTADQKISDENIFEIAPNRIWSLNGSLDLPQDLRADLTIHRDSILDLLQTTEGIIGLVTRLNDSSEWRLHLPTIFDPDLDRITIPDVPINRQWAIARISDQATFVNELTSLERITVYPNPSHGSLNLLLEVSESLVIDLNLVSLDGSLVKEIYKGQLSAGIHNIGIDISHLGSAFYVLSCKTRQGKVMKRLVLLN